MSGKYTLQYASNFFLDLHKRRDFNKMLIPSSENLALLGNISRISSTTETQVYKEFLNYCSKHYKNVYLIPGAYELCSNDYAPIAYEECSHNLCNLLKQYNNISMLNNSHTTIQNTNINLVGSTLWVRKPYLNHQCTFEHNKIWLKRHSGLGKLMGNDIVHWHLEDLEYLNNITKANKQYIVLTHHLPNSILTHDKIRKCMETSNLEKYMKKPIEIWVGGAGDTSVSGTFGIVRDVFCTVNPYTTFELAKHRINDTYNPEAFISLRTQTNELV